MGQGTVDLSTLPTWAHYLATAIAYFVEALLPFLQRQSSLYWPFLLSTLVIGAIAWKISGPRDGSRNWRSFRRQYLGRSLWWHPSARVDYRYYLVNAVLFPIIVGPALFTGATLGKFLDWAAGPLLGPPGSLAEPGIALRIAYTVLFFVAYDFGRFVAHCAQHEIPLLWEFHKVHHSAEVLTPITAFRAHPLDLAIMFWGGVVVTGVVTWVFERATGTLVTDYVFFGLNALIWVSSLVGNLNHWQIPISYGPLDRWFISPVHHQLHHSAEPQHFGMNRGFQFAIWDRWYGTLCLPQAGQEFRMGLGDGSDGKWHRLGRLYWWPFRHGMRRLARPRDDVDIAGEPL